MREELNIKIDDLLQNDFPEMPKKMNRHELRSVLNHFRGWFVAESSQSFQNPLVKEVMEFLEKSGNGVIQKSELKEALEEFINEKTGSS